MLHGVAVGDYNDHPYTVEVAHGWTTDEHHHFMFKAAAEALFMSVWRVGEVPTDPCHWKGTEVDAGPSVAKLVEQLTTQRSRKASAPKDTTLAGYDGRYFEWSVPEDLVQTGDSEFESCDDPGTGSPHFYSWFGEYGGGRYQQVAGQRDRIWVLDVRGQTMVVDASYTPAATAADRMELDQAVASLQFQGP